MTIKDPDKADDFDYLVSSRSSVRSNPIQTNQLRAVSPTGNLLLTFLFLTEANCFLAAPYDPYMRDPYIQIEGHQSSEENV